MRGGKVQQATVGRKQCDECCITPRGGDGNPDQRVRFVDQLEDGAKCKLHDAER